MKQYKKYIIIDKVNNIILDTDNIDEYQDLERMYISACIKSKLFTFKYLNFTRMMVVGI